MVLTSEDPRTEKAEDIIKQIRFGIKENLYNVHDFVDREKAIAYALESARKGDMTRIPSSAR